VGPRGGLDTGVERTIPSPAGTRTPIIQPVAQRYTKLHQLYENQYIVQRIDT